MDFQTLSVNPSAPPPTLEAWGPQLGTNLRGQQTSQQKKREKKVTADFYKERKSHSSGIVRTKAFLKVHFSLRFSMSAEGVPSSSWDAATFAKGKAIENQLGVCCGFVYLLVWGGFGFCLVFVSMFLSSVSCLNKPRRDGNFFPYEHYSTSPKNLLAIMACSPSYGKTELTCFCSHFNKTRHKFRNFEACRK